MFNFDHVSLSVKNIDISIKFYEKLEFKLYQRWDDSDKKLSIVLMKNGTMILEMFCYKTFRPLPEYRKLLSSDLEVLGTKHFGLNVENIVETSNYLSAIGICKNPQIQKGRLGRDYFFIQDPDGILIEIIQGY